MNLRSLLFLATLTLSASAFGQGYYQIGYAANLNIGDSVVNVSNSGAQGGFFGATPPTVGNICVNAYVFDPQEEEIGCCTCLVTPNGLNSLSAKNDLTSNNLTPNVPTSITIKLVASQPGTDTTGAFNLCNAATVGNETSGGMSVFGAVANVPYSVDVAGNISTGSLAAGMLAWGTTLEPNAVLGTYGVVNVPFIQATLGGASLGLAGTGVTGTGLGTGTTLAFFTGKELFSLTSVCNFIKANGSGFGICNSCRLGALGGSKK